MYTYTYTPLKYKNIFINRTDLEDSEQHQPLTKTGTATKTRSDIANPVHPNGKCINLVYF